MELNQNRTVTPRQLAKALKYCVKAKRPAFIHGSPGIGKSDMIAKLCADMGGRLYDLRVATMEITDIRGMPYFDKDTKQMLWAPPVDLPTQEEASKYPIVFLFLDELASAAPSTQGACYQLVLNRRVGTYVLPDNCVVIAAGNKDSDKAISYRMPTPLANRLIHFELRVDFDSWQEWALDNLINPEVVGFLTHAPNNLFDFDPKSPSKAFATPRSWEFVSQILTDDIDEATASDIIAGTIGEGLMLKFMAHRKIAGKLPSIDDIINGKVDELKTKDISALYSLATSIAYRLKELSDNKDKEWNTFANNAIAFMMKCFGPEIIVMSIRAMMQNYKLVFNPAKIPAIVEFNNKWGSLILKSARM